ncbi:MAG: methyltransferase family protein [Anaerolineae bacterium]
MKGDLINQLGIPILAQRLSLPHPALTGLLFAALTGLGLWLAAASLPLVDRYLPGGPVTTQALLEVSWLALMVWGFMGQRRVYRKRYGERAYRQAAIRYFFPAFVLMVVGLSRPGFVKGPRLWPAWAGWIAGGLLLTQGTLLSWRAMLAFGLDRATLIYSYFPEEDVLVESKLYAFLRHPLYAMWLHLALGLALVNGSLVALGCAAVFLSKVLIWTWWEERELVERFGVDYEDYRRRTPAFFPRLRAVPAFWWTLIRGQLPGDD